MAAEDARLSRRTLLRRSVGVGGAVTATASSGLFHAGAADTGSRDSTVPTADPERATVAGETAPLRVTVTFAGNAPTAHLERHLRPALESYAVQCGVDAEVARTASVSRSVALDDDYAGILDRFERWAADGAVDRREGHVNLLCYAQSPVGGSAYACDHRGTLAADTAPIAVCNTDVALFWPATAYHNTLITALARPVLAGALGQGLPNGEEVASDVNAFGTVFPGDPPRSSPLATWHTPAAGGCVKLNNYEGEDVVESHCGHETVQESCGYTTRCSECTVVGTRARLAAL
ncbi:hypothetical protein ACKVMT_16620 [Halobacteriales archaeon Cl-PHB]